MFAPWDDDDDEDMDDALEAGFSGEEGAQLESVEGVTDSFSETPLFGGCRRSMELAPGLCAPERERGKNQKEKKGKVVLLL